VRADRSDLRAMTPALAAGIPVAALVSCVTTARVRRGSAPVLAATLYRLALAVLVAARESEESA
jgi:hypothetical protein